MLTTENFSYTAYQWRDRQAGVGVIFDPEREQFIYNAYCVETKLMKELFSCEFDFLEDALALVNEEYSNWEEFSFDKKGCGTCVAK
jgi:hypothetical protein